MSINRLLGQNNYNLYSNEITVNTATVSGTLNVDGTIAIDGDLNLQNNKKITMDAWTGSDKYIPDHIDLWGSTFGLGITSGNLNIIADGASDINQNIGTSTITKANNGGFSINRNTEINSGSGLIQSQLNINTDDITPNNCAIVLGNSTGYYAIQRTGNNKELSIFQSGDSVNTNVVFTTGTGRIIQFGTGGMQLNGELEAGDVKIGGKIYDSLNSPGTNGQLLTSTGTGILWNSLYEDYSNTVAWAGPWTTPQNGILLIARMGKMVTVTFVVTLAAAALLSIITGTGIIPLNFRPSYENKSLFIALNNTVLVESTCLVQTSGNVILSVGLNGGGFGGIGDTCGFQTFSVSYALV